MSQPRRALQLPPVTSGHREQSILPPSSVAQQDATSAVPRLPLRSSPSHRANASVPLQRGRVRSQHQDARVVALLEESGGGAEGPQRSGGELVPQASSPPLVTAGGGLVPVLQAEVVWLREQLRSKDEQVLKLLEAKDEQMQAKDEQMQQVLKLLAAKDEQMQEQLQAKDQQISGFMASMSPIAHASATPRHFPASPVPYNPMPLPSPPVGSPMAATTEQRRHTRQVHLRAAAEAAPRQTTASRDRSAERTAEEEVVAKDSAPAVALSELQAGGQAAEAALAAVLEHGLEALESIPRVPRKEKKIVRRLCEQVESMLEGLDTDQATQLAEQCEAAKLAELHRALDMVSSMCVGMVGMECVEAVESLLGLWKQCSDPLVRASRVLRSEEAEARMRGLETLRRLPRVVLAEAVEAEVALVSAAGAIGLDKGRSHEERMLAWLAVFALGLRNSSVEALGKLCAIQSKMCDAVLKPAYSGRLDGKQGLAVYAACHSVLALMQSLATQLESESMRASAEKSILESNSQYTRVECTAARCKEHLTQLLDLSKDEDSVLAAGALLATANPLLSSGAVCAKAYMSSQDRMTDILALLRRIGALGQPAAWWRKRSARVNLDAVLMYGIYACVTNTMLGFLQKMPSGSTAWEQLLAESIHILKMNQEAKLSKQPQLIFQALWTAAKLICIVVREQSRHQALLASGVVSALLWTTAHDKSYLGATLAEFTAVPTVALIGRNEGGLTLTREAVNAVLNTVHMYWDGTSTHWRVKSAAKSPVTKLVGKALPIVDIVIADANKPFVVQHPTALDDLVHSLLVDESHPRRAQEGAAKLQEISALVLQNLALSDVGKTPLRSHADVMAALRSVASSTGGLSDQARRYAEGALFELDEAVRRKRKDAAASMSTQDGDATAVEHVMLSYNWDHQDVIKRINSALKAYDYAVWIDIEKMQGSTVEAMADAVENAACVCYGISRAYKESVNCRMEAQYAFQQKKDMVPLMLEEGYSPNGWLGMLLGVRLWYGFYGATLASVGAFEGKIKELCRELGERGTCAGSQVAVKVATTPSIEQSASKARLMSSDNCGRIEFVDGILECADRIMSASVSRKTRKELRKRIDALLEALDMDNTPAWLASSWTDQQAVAVLEASEALWAAEKTTDMSSSDAGSVVTTVLAVLEQMVEAHVDKAEALLVSIQNNDADQVVAVLEHGLALLEKRCLSTPRKARKAIDELCEQLEHAMESLDEDGTMEQLASCEISELTALAEQLKATSSLDGDAGNDCVQTVKTMLETLMRCLDPVLRSSRQLTSADAATRMRGLEALRGLPRVVLAEPLAAEVAAAAILAEIEVDIDRDCAERQAAAMGVFAVGFRNGTATIEVLGKLYVDCQAGVYAPWFANELSGRDGVALAVASGTCVWLLSEFGTKSETATLRGAVEKKILAGLGKFSRLDCTRARYAELLPILLELLEHDDLVLASCAANCTIWPIQISAAVCAPVLVASREYPDAILALMRRIQCTRQLRQPAAWWKERSEAVHLDSCCLLALAIGPQYFSTVSPTMPPNSAAWEELLAESIHICKVNQELSAQPKICWQVMLAALKIVAWAAHEQSRHKSLLASGVVDALLWVTAHDSVWVGVALAESSAAATVALIGRNEGGLTLSRETVHTVLNVVHMYWDTTSTHWRVKSAAKAPVTKLISKIQPVVDIVIADANKPFVLEHATAVDDLVRGLLVDHSSPRRTQDGAGKLQETCALALQNLALSDVGKGPLRSHSSVITSLRVVASAEGGMTEKARQYAAGALFELDEVARQKAKDAAAAAKAAAQTDDGEAAEHVMLSYNWGHQDVIKRINAALKGHGYSVWIDIEKMQGSTVEAMADAVEDAAVVCYGISAAYKESVNCRMEAQYAFQQQKEMVPLMLEEGYRAKGWLGMILGMRLWYGFYGATLASEGAFEGKIKELCRELGERGTCAGSQAAVTERG